MPPPAPESKTAAVLDDGVADCVGGRWRKPGTAPSGSSLTLIDNGVTIHDFAACGGCERLR